MPDAVFSEPGDGERFVRSDRTLTIRADLGELSATEIEFEPSFRVEQHTHTDHVDAFYVLEGVVEFLLEDGPRLAEQGTFVAVPPGVLHGFANPGPGRARLLNLHAPDSGFAESIRAY